MFHSTADYFLIILIHKIQKSKMHNARNYRTTVHAALFCTKLLMGSTKYLKNKDLIFWGLANLPTVQPAQITVTSRLFFLMQSRVRLLVPPLRTPSPSWGDGGGPDKFMPWAECRDRLEACKDASLCWRLVGSVCRSHPDVCGSSWCWSLAACSTGCWLLVGCRSLRSSNSSLFSSSDSASSCLLRRSAPNRARMSHITRDSWPWMERSHNYMHQYSWWHVIFSIQSQSQPDLQITMSVLEKGLGAPIIISP